MVDPLGGNDRLLLTKGRHLWHVHITGDRGRHQGGVLSQWKSVCFACRRSQVLSPGITTKKDQAGGDMKDFCQRPWWESWRKKFGGTVLGCLKSVSIKDVCMHGRKNSWISTFSSCLYNTCYSQICMPSIVKVNQHSTSKQ